ncbi:MAG: tripartite tricarboxylate transporter substrate binding protein [Betaproteobacteria bacterium]|nr:tripartite tricarboxylate transporter substrate binding protein [Betaproteobacteria bacterium]
MAMNNQSGSYLLCVAGTALLACGIFGSSVLAASFPEKPVRIIVPFPPGGGADLVTRVTAPKMSQSLGQSLVIDNRGGANSNIGADLVAKAPADGYTLLTATANLAMNASLYPKLPYDLVRDFAPVTMLAVSAFVMTTHPSVGASNVNEFIAVAKTKQLNYASNGSGSPAHLAAEMFKTATKVQMVHVPYKGSGPAVTDLMGNQVQVMFGSMASTLPFVKSGRLKALAVTTLKRSAVAPELPTVAESGFPGFEITTWYGYLAPARTPASAIQRLNAETIKALNEPEVKNVFSVQGLDVVGNSPQEFSAMIRKDIAKYAEVIKASGARLE